MRDPEELKALRERAVAEGDASFSRAEVLSLLEWVDYLDGEVKSATAYASELRRQAAARS